MSDEVSMDPAVAWAASGVVALTGHRDGPPLLPPGGGAIRAGQAADRLAEVTGRCLDGAALLAERAALTGSGRAGRVSAGGASRLLPTADGWAALSCARPDDALLLAALTGGALAPDPWPEVAAWLREHTGADLALGAAELGLAAAPVELAGVPAIPAAGPPRSVAGLRVVDFSALWAGPLCAHVLGLAGADVIKVEVPQRLDGARRGDARFYDLLHAGHRAVLLEPGTAPGRAALHALVAAADIVIEASRPRALAGFGLDAAATAAAGTTWISITAAGRDSPRVGFGDDIAASAGLVALDRDRRPVFCGDALADPLTGLVAAELALSEPSGPGGTVLDVAMTGVVAATLAGRAAGEPAPAARRHGSGWVVPTPAGPVPVAAPRAREPSGRAPAPGQHTAEVLRELGIPRP